MKVQARIITAHSCAASLKACDPDDFSNPYILLKIAATLPVTSCDCERSISTKRILRDVPWVRLGFPHWLSCTGISSTNRAELGNWGA